MIAIICEYKPENKTDEYSVVIQADTTPGTFPLNGTNVKRKGGDYLGAEVKFAPGSIIHCVDTGKNYYLNESGTTWNEDGGSAE